jgi:YidC/Oxa1 family membrane protein insertase
VERNLFLAIVLSMAVLMFWQFLFTPPMPVQRPSGPSAPGVAPSGDAPEFPVQRPERPVAGLSPEAQPIPPPSTDRSEERIVVIDTPLYRAEVTNRGAGLRSFRLKRYDTRPKDANPVEMVPQVDDIYTYYAESSEADRLQVLQRLRTEFDNLWLPYSVRIPERQPDGQIVGHGLAIHQIDPSPERFELAGTDSARLTFRLNLPSGLRLTKTLTFHAETYLTEVSLLVENPGTAALVVAPEIVVTDGYRSSGIRPSTQYDHSTPVYGADGKRHIPDIPELGAQDHVQRAKLDWVATEDLYFFSALIPQGQVQTLLLEKPAGLRFLRLLLRFDEFRLEPGQARDLSVLGYYGPKENDRLASIGYQLDRIIDYGMFRFLALPAVEFLKFVQRLTGSYGVAIIILTLVLKVVTYPLTAAQLRSMERMKALAPDLERIRAKFKDTKDTERYNQEMMNLYRRHGVNPASGCLPILIQMPIFLALYSGLLYSIEMRHTAFLYIPDLSNPDPYYLSPLLMGVSMLLQSKMSPAPADPSQAMMMKIMPIMFTGLFLFAPAGLVIYWLMNNVLSIGQQYWMRNRTQKA